jgi:D-arabinose 1-dehydrogenase-like Zn-dependent alcohol dehydrogenase
VGDTMPAVRLHRAGPADRRDVRVEEVPISAPGRGQVRVEMRAVALGGADRAVVEGLAHRTAPAPMILGREGAGVVAAVGDDVTDWREGDGVVLLAVRGCRRCPACDAGRDNLCPDAALPGVDVDGLLCASVIAQDADLVPLPGALDPAGAALLADTAGSAYHALKRSGVGEGITLAVLGLGGVGQYAVQLAVLAGCRVIGVDPDPDARRAALAAGADEAVDAQDPTVASIGADRAVVCTREAAAVGQALEAVRDGGRVTMIASEVTLPPLPGARLVPREIDLVGSYAATAQDVGELVDLAEDGRLDLSHGRGATLALDDAATHLSGVAPGRAVVVLA